MSQTLKIPKVSSGTVTLKLMYYLVINFKIMVMGIVFIKGKAFAYKINLVIVHILLFQAVVNAQIPEGYYDSASDLTNDALKTALNGIVDGHTTYPYTSSGTDVWDILKVADRDPNDATKVIGIYSGFSMDAAAEYNSGSGWSREHVWAKSRGDFGTSSGAGTDCHHIAAEDVSTNSARNNRNFDWGDLYYTDAGGSYSGATQSKIGDSGNWIWEPRDSKKGDVARMILYMVVRYEGVGGEPDLELTETLLINTDKSPLHAKQSVLLEWHNLDPVSSEEEARNEVIYGYQGNRNPFIDYPEYVCKIWGGSCGTAPSIENISHSPSNPESSDAVSVSADITDDGSINSASLYWGTDNSTFPNSVNMAVATAPTYTTSNTIPAQVSGTTVYYKITAVDNDAETTTSNVNNYIIPQGEPLNYPTLFATGAITSSTIQLSWTDASSGTLPHGYLIKASSVNSDVILVPSDGSEESDADLVKNVIQGTQTATFNGLDAGSNYYFKIFPYCNSGSSIDYKTDATPPNVSGTTDVASVSVLETFDNYAITSGIYADGTFAGQEGSNWTFYQCRGDMQISEATPCLGKGRTPDGEVSSGTIDGGCGTIRFDYKQAFSTNVNLELYVNEELITTVTSSSQQGEVLNTGDIIVNKTGSFSMKFVNTSSSAGQVSIDNISWTPYSLLISNDDLIICESELPYDYNGKTINEGATSGTIDFTFTSFTGCDSIVTLALTINPVYKTTDELVICESELPYNYNGKTINEGTTSGDIEFTFASESGCDSVVTLALTVNAVYSTSDELVICENELPYDYNGNTINEGTTSGAIDFTFISLTGCDSVVTLALTVNAVYSTSDELVICESELPYDYSGKTIIEGTTSSDIDFIFKSVTGCDSIVILTLTVNSGYNEAAIASICEGETYSFGSQSLTIAGNYIETFQSIYSCDSIVTLTLSVKSVEKGVTQDGVTLTADDIEATYQWVKCGDELTTIEGETSQAFTATENGDYAVIITQNECVEKSECYSITGVGVIENSFVQEITLFPNPTAGNLTIDTKVVYT